VTEVIIAVISGLIGFFASLAAQGRSAKRRNNSAKKLVSAEIDKNLFLLQSIYEDALLINNQTNTGEVDYGDDKDLLQLAKQLLGIPMRKNTRYVFESQLESLGLSPTDELNSIFSLYDYLASLNSIVTTLENLWEKQERQWQLVSHGRDFVPLAECGGIKKMFNEQAPNIIIEYIEISTLVMKKGNPLLNE